MQAGKGEGGAAVFLVEPDDLLAFDQQAMGQGMAPAATEADVQLGGTGAVEPGEGKRQASVEGAVVQGQQFFAGDHRHRAAVGAGLVGVIGGVAVGVC
ncbi:hypothetical protein FHK92_19545 [Pseudomonas brassicacearum subsp. neoaurantiaca]|uniref:Uncharacterized protein n=1 Tax=Pseudomonas brassicacearum subsp. neoaurantiaca TaxID=494916 RepID=A0A7V8UE97_9PSED|nr:hypothetical protein [Pseudomonas brassicacearum subsp. neoaurantiaca]